MKIYDSAWQECDSLPSDAVLLVSARGTEYVRKIEEALRAHKFPYYVKAYSRADVDFLVPSDKHDEIRDTIKGS